MFKRTLQLVGGAWEAMQLHHRLWVLRLRLALTRRRIRQLRRIPQQAYEEAENVCRESAQAQFRAILQATSTDTLTEHGGSARLLQRSGYHRLSDLIGASPERLQQLPGIGPVKSQQIIYTYKQVAHRLTAQVKLLPSPEAAVVHDYAPLIAIARHFRLSKECEARATALSQQEEQLRTQLRDFGLPTMDFIKSHEIREPWRNYKAKLHQNHAQLQSNSDSAYQRLSSLQVERTEAWWRYKENPQYFRTIVNQFDFNLSA